MWQTWQKFLNKVVLVDLKNGQFIVGELISINEYSFQLKNKEGLIRERLTEDILGIAERGEK